MIGGEKAYLINLENNIDDLIVNYSTLVKKIAHHLIGRLPPCVQLDDLVQSGMIGLLEAAKNYDGTKGASFDTYAGIRVRGAMIDEIRKGDWAPRSVHRNTRMVAQAIHEIENKSGRDARDHEVATHLNISLDEYHKILQDSLGTKIFAFEDLGVNDEVYLDNLVSNFVSPFEGVENGKFKEQLSLCIANLPEKERLVLSLYYDEELNLREVGKIMGISESRVSQIHSQAMLRLQSRMKDWRIDD